WAREPLGTVTERARKQAVVRNEGRFIDTCAQRAHGFARRLRAIARRKDGAGPVDLLDRPDHEHGTQGFFTHRDGILTDAAPSLRQARSSRAETSASSRQMSGLCAGWPRTFA